MNYVFLGAGQMARAGALHLLEDPDTTSIGLVDRSQAALAATRAFLGSDERVSFTQGDLSNPEFIMEQIAPAQGVFNAAHYGLNEALMSLSIEARKHYVDLGGNTAIVRKQLERNEAAKAAGITCLPDCGLAPGLANMMAAALLKDVPAATIVTIRVGGIPENPEPPLGYRLLFSPAGLINEYKESPLAIRNGQQISLDPLGDLEDLEFPGLPRLEAFNTYGGASTMPYTYQGKLEALDYKTIRYRGHCEKIRFLFSLGFDSEVPGPGGITPRSVLETQLALILPSGGPDLSLVRVDVRSEDSGRRLQLIDRSVPEKNLTSMMRTTAFPTAILLRMAMHGQLPAGVMAPETLEAPSQFFSDLEAAGIHLERSIL